MIKQTISWCVVLIDAVSLTCMHVFQQATAIVILVCLNQYLTRGCRTCSDIKKCTHDTGHWCLSQFLGFDSSSPCDITCDNELKVVAKARSLQYYIRFFLYVPVYHNCILKLCIGVLYALQPLCLVAIGKKHYNYDRCMWTVICSLLHVT